MRLRNYILVFVCLVSIVGCADSHNEDAHNETSNKGILLEQSALNSNFKNQYSDAKRYGELTLSGIALSKEGRLEEALAVFKDALENHAAMRNEKAAASDHIAKTLEALGKYGEAAKYYDLASKKTLNSDRESILSAKAIEMQERAASN